MDDSFEAGVSLPAGYVLHAHACLPSTIDEASRLAQEGAPSGTLVLAKEQTAGRGRRGNPWSSYAGNLHLSCVLRPRLSLSQMSCLSFVASVAAGHAILPFLGNPSLLQYKWPNDILIDGFKVGGCVVDVGPSLASEDKPSWVVLSVGVNLCKAPHGMDYPVSCLKDLGLLVDGEAILSFFCTELQPLLKSVEDQGFETVRAMWMGRAWGMGETLSIDVGDGLVYQGVAEGITAEGALLLKKYSGEKVTIPTGHVMRVPDKIDAGN
ncbi:biotin--[acetyl-CoA-carboxylase] ligase [Candidatus Hepatobacter penaei]|uniref:biotin--[acetyl-CoA-carboxylase] ligase n=1 Tax=Candidatus Hepatobacter penaei TaxID=1274402 RepID=UPI0004F3373B|nr:biotin--[acetyl-CoA-carboxylase] ligase [Candidatus Hepatobacter penaei]TGW15797.1 biotin--[acetyl-CoA-carboxylase] ligase [bacterium NHP-B]